MIKPINNNILVEITNNHKKESLIIINEQQSQKYGIVKNINNNEKEIKIGDSVIFDIKDIFYVDNSNYVIINQNQILGIMEESL